MDNEEARSEAAAKIENCISEICTWMKTNAIKLNKEKPEYIVFSKNKNEAHMTLLAGTQVAKSQHCKNTWSNLSRGVNPCLNKGGIILENRICWNTSGLRDITRHVEPRTAMAFGGMLLKKIFIMVQFGAFWSAFCNSLEKMFTNSANFRKTVVIFAFFHR